MPKSTKPNQRIPQKNHELRSTSSWVVSMRARRVSAGETSGAQLLQTDTHLGLSHVRLSFLSYFLNSQACLILHDIAWEK